MKKTVFSAILFSLTLLACDGAGGIAPEEKAPTGKNRLAGLSNQVVLDWNVTAYEAMGGATYQHSLQASRINAMTHIAMHDALNAIAPNYQTYAFKGKDAQADPIAAAASAAHSVLTAVFPDKTAMLNEQLAKSLVGITDGTGKTRGIALGKEAAQAILDQRAQDGADQNPVAEINNPNEPGLYQGVPPTPFVFAPHWKTMKPFALQKPEQFRSAPRPALTSKAYADAFNEVKNLGRSDSPQRTAEQTAYARFWYEFSEAGWNRVARVAIAARKLDLVQSARLLALVNMALADSYTAGWDSKFHYNFWRPYTAIRGAETDGNPATTADAGWESLMPTPPVHDYPSTHSVLGNAAATVLAVLLGDKTAFAMTSPTAESPTTARNFGSFSQAANENADSRVMAGIHFRFSCEAGQEMGNKIGKWTVTTQLKPIGQPY